jgi:hypothetical protein
MMSGDRLVPAATLEDMLRRIAEIAATTAAAEAEYERLRGLLLEYGRHQEGCNAQYGATYRCRCGWRGVEAEFTQASGT